jgi:DNA-binding MarR family transcriptional regulator
MSENLNETAIAMLATRRRKIMELEQSIFKSRTHTSIEILIFLAENRFSAKLAAIYEKTQATDASVRQHLRALEQLNFVRQMNDEDDGRAKSIAMTTYGREQLELYASELAILISDGAA